MSNAHFYVDPDLCQCTGQCLHLAPAYFDVGADGVAFATSTAPAPDRALADMVIASCPGMAITLSDGEERDRS